MNVPDKLKYTATHEWVEKNDNGTITIGITYHAQEALGDLVFVELPEIGKKLSAKEEVAVVESVKAASDIYAPVAGIITDINPSVADAPESINHDPYAAWLFKMRPENMTDLDELLDAAAYQASCEV